MTDDALKRKLQSVGIECFIKHFDLFLSEASFSDVVEVLRKESQYTEKSCKSRASHGLGIVRQGKARAALQKISNSSSKNVSDEVRQLAKELLFKSEHCLGAKQKFEEDFDLRTNEQTEFATVQHLWNKYNEYANKLSRALGRTSNIVGEYAEYIAHQHYGGVLLNISNASADICSSEGIRYQVKARKIKSGLTTQLSIIRSWDFEYLVVCLFGQMGELTKAVEVPVSVAKEYAAENSHQNGWVITTNVNFLNDVRCVDITDDLKRP